jgi:TusA-related sulfurtransferase
MNPNSKINLSLNSDSNSSFSDASICLDLLDLACPKPLLFTKKKLSELATGQVLAIWVNQEKNLEDLKFFCKAAGHVLLKIEPLATIIEDAEENAWVFYIQKSGHP